MYRAKREELGAEGLRNDLGERTSFIRGGVKVSFASSCRVFLIILAVTVLTGSAAAAQVSSLLHEALPLWDDSGSTSDLGFSRPFRNLRTETLPESVCRPRAADCMRDVFPFRPFRRGELGTVGAGIGAFLGTVMMRSPEAAITLGTAGALAAGRLEDYAWKRTEAYCRAKYCFTVVER